MSVPGFDSFPLASLTLAAPLLLGGLVMLFLPVIAHWLQAKLRQVLLFPSIRFLDPSAQGHRRLHKLRQFLLLLLRLFCLALFVCAFAEPHWWRSKAEASRKGQGATLFLVDVTPSMGQETLGRSQLDEAKGAIQRILGEVEKEGDVAALCTMPHSGENEKILFQSPSALRGDVDALYPGSSRADPVPVFRKAVSALKAHPGPGRIVILSDFQDTNWPDRLPGDLGEGITWQRIDLSEAGTENLSLHAGSYSPPHPAEGDICQVAVEVKNHGLREVSSRVELLRNEKVVGAQTVSVAGGDLERIEMSLAVDKEGDSELEFRLRDPDTLAIDNRYTLVLNTGGKPQIALWSDADPRRPGSAAFYLQRAMAPKADGANGYSVDFLDASDVEMGISPSVETLVLGGLAPCTPASLQSIAAYLDQGGRVIWFAGDAAFRQAAAELDKGLEAGRMPWIPEQLEQWDEQEARYLGGVEAGAPYVDHFPLEMEAAFGRIPIWSRWKTGPVHPEALSLLRFRDGTSAVSLRTLASGGECIVINASPEAKDSELGRSGFFVALLQTLLEAPQKESPGGEYLIGDALTLDVELKADQKPRGVRMTDPSGKTLFEAEMQLRGQQLKARMPQTLEPGFYRLWLGEELLAAEAVNLDPRESDLRVMDLDKRDQLFRGEGVSRSYANAAEGDALLPQRSLPLWGWFLLVALMGLTAESCWLAREGR